MVQAFRCFESGPRRPGLVLASILVLCATRPAAGADAGQQREAGQYRVAVTPVLGYRMGGSFDDDGSEDEVELDDDSMVGLIINVPYRGVTADDYTEWELYVSRQSTGIDSAPSAIDPDLEIDITHVLIGGTYVGAGEVLRPFLSAGIGAAHLSPDASGYDSDTVFAFGIGGGAQFLPANRVGARLEGRLLGSVVDSDSSIFCASGPQGAGCAFRANGDVLWQWEVSAGVTVRF